MSKGLGSNAQEEQLIDHLEAYAMSNPVPRGRASISSDTFAGWPLDVLAEEAFGTGWRAIPSAAKAVAGLKARHLSHQFPTTPPVEIPPSLPSPEEMLSMRMRWQRWGGFGAGFAHVAVHTVGDTVHVWVIAKDAQSTVLTDDAALFPSDALITKLNMMKRE